MLLLWKYVQNILGSWQSQVWDPAVSSKAFDKFCEAINAPVFGRGISAEAVNLPFGSSERMVEIEKGFKLDLSVLNYANYIKNGTVARCPTTVEDVGISQILNHQQMLIRFWFRQCFGTYNDTQFQDTGLDQDWRLWQFQVCTQWGYFTARTTTVHHFQFSCFLLDLTTRSCTATHHLPPHHPSLSL